MMLNFIYRFKDDEDGSMAIELLLVVPILLWTLLSTFVYFDVYRTESNSIRAALTVADMLSREQVSIDDAYLDGALQLLKTLTFTEDDPEMRVTVYRFDDPDSDGTGDYRVVWSQTLTGSITDNYTEESDIASDISSGLANDDMDSLQANGRLPLLAHNARSILLETRTRYSAPFSIGLGPFTVTDLSDVNFTTFTVIRPRFGVSLCFDEAASINDLC